MPDLESIRSTEFPSLRDGIYLNAASTGPLPTRTAGVVDEWTRMRQQPARIPLEDMFGTLREARARCATLVGAASDEIALVPNTSTGINLAAAILPVRAGQTILGHDGEFPANVYPWMGLAKRTSATYEQLPLDAGGCPDWDALPERLARGDVAILAISWVSFVSGDRADLESIGRLCRAHDVRLVVDAIQGVGVAPLDVKRADIDVLACGAQKWLLSPWGSAFTYVRRELVAKSEPVAVGWISVRNAEDFSRMLEYDLTYFDDARRFEVATIAYQDIAGMNASLALLDELGADAIRAHVASLATRLVEGIDAIPGLRLVTPRDPSRRAGIVSFRARDAAALSARLDSANIAHSIRGASVIRLAPHIYNTAEEMDATLALLDG